MNCLLTILIFLHLPFLKFLQKFLIYGSKRDLMMNRIYDLRISREGETTNRGPVKRAGVKQVSNEK